MTKKRSVVDGKLLLPGEEEIVFGTVDVVAIAAVSVFVGIAFSPMFWGLFDRCLRICD